MLPSIAFFRSTIRSETSLVLAIEPYTKCSIPKAKANANTIRMARYFA